MDIIFQIKLSVPIFYCSTKILLEDNGNTGMFGKRKQQKIITIRVSLLKISYTLFPLKKMKFKDEHDLANGYEVFQLMCCSSLNDCTGHLLFWNLDGFSLKTVFCP